MIRDKVAYAQLNARQKENYFVAARLALYGYNSIRLTDDYAGADFLAVHRDGDVLKVQLKSRMTLDRKYCGKGVHLAFRTGDRVFVYDHDAIIPEVLAATNLEQTVSWSERGAYSWNRLPKFTDEILTRYELCP